MEILTGGGGRFWKTMKKFNKMKEEEVSNKWNC